MLYLKIFFFYVIHNSQHKTFGAAKNLKILILPVDDLKLSATCFKMTIGCSVSEIDAHIVVSIITNILSQILTLAPLFYNLMTNYHL